MPYNLESPNTLLEAIDAANMERWYVRETVQVESEAVRHVLHHVAGHLTEFVAAACCSAVGWLRPPSASGQEAEVSQLSRINLEASEGPENHARLPPKRACESSLHVRRRRET